MSTRKSSLRWTLDHALNIPLQKQRLAELRSDREVVAYCPPLVHPLGGYPTASTRLPGTTAGGRISRMEDGRVTNWAKPGIRHLIHNPALFSGRGSFPKAGFGSLESRIRNRTA
jgi:hypothetical protein